MKFNKSLFFKTDEGVLVAEASSIGLPPCEFPLIVEVDSVEYYSCETDYCDGGEDIAGINYRSKCGQKLLIIND